MANALPPQVLSRQNQAPEVPGGVTSRADLRVFQEHGEILEHWRGQGISRASAIILDAHLDFKYIPESRIDQLRSLHREGQSFEPWVRHSAFTPRSRHLTGFDDFLYAAWKLGLLREIRWVIPTRGSFGDEALASILWQNLETIQGIGSQAMAGWKTSPGLALADLEGIRIGACTLGTLASGTFPPDSLVDIDLDYFESSFPTQEQALAEVMEHLERIHLSDRMETATLSVTNGFLRPEGAALASSMGRRAGKALKLSPETETDTFPMECLVRLRQVGLGTREKETMKEALLHRGPPGILVLALMAIRDGDLAAAQERILQVQALGEDISWPAFQLGSELAGRGRYPEAEFWLEKGEGELGDSLEVRSRIFRLICMCRRQSWRMALEGAAATAVMFPMIERIPVIAALASDRLGLREESRSWKARSAWIGQARSGGQ